MSFVIPDVEDAIRTWLRGLTEVTALVDHRVWWSADPRSDFPYLVVSLVGSPPETSDAPIVHRTLQIDAIDTERQRTRCFAVIAAVESALLSIRQPVALSTDVVCYGAVVQSVLYLPDPGSAAPRYTMTVEVTVRSTAAV